MEIDDLTRERIERERIEEAADWLSYPVHLSFDERGEVHVALFLSVGDPAHYEEQRASKKKKDDVTEFVSEITPCATSVLVTFKEPNVIDNIRIEHRDDCLVIHNVKGSLAFDLCTLMSEVLKVNRSTASRTFNRINQGRERQIRLVRPRRKWMLSQRA